MNKKMPVVRVADNQAERHTRREATVQVHGLRAAVPQRRDDDRR